MRRLISKSGTLNSDTDKLFSRNVAVVKVKRVEGGSSKRCFSPATSFALLGQRRGSSQTTTKKIGLGSTGEG